MVSMGRSEAAKIIGVAFVAINAVLIALQLVGLVSADDPSIKTRSLVAISVLPFCTYEVWAFTHGKATFIDVDRLEAVAERTSLRTIGLLGDLLVWVVLVWYLFVS